MWQHFWAAGIHSRGCGCIGAAVLGHELKRDCKNYLFLPGKGKGERKVSCQQPCSFAVPERDSLAILKSGP